MEENMRKLQNVIGMLMLVFLITFPLQAQAAEKNVQETLKECKTYSFNLDKKGKKETVQFDVTKKKSANGDGYDYNATVQVNGKVIYRKNLKNYSYSFPVKVMVVDTDKKDKQMELLIMEGVGQEAWCTDFEKDLLLSVQKRKNDAYTGLSTDLSKAFRQDIHASWNEREKLSVNKWKGRALCKVLSACRKL